MPTIKELGDFTKHFRTIGNEAGIVAGRGEPYNELPLPETEPAGNPFADFENSSAENAAFENDTALSESGAALSSNAPNDDLDFSAFLDTIPDDLTENANDALSQNTETIDNDFDLNDGLGDLLSGFADDIEAGQASPDFPEDFTDPEFSNPDIPGNAIDADFEEIGNVDIPSGKDNFPNSELDDFNNLQETNDSPTSELNNFDIPQNENDSSNSDSGMEDFSLPENFDESDNANDFNFPDDASSNDDAANLDPSNDGAFDFGNLDNLNLSEGTPTVASDNDFDDLNLPETASENIESIDDTADSDFADLGDFDLPEKTPDQDQIEESPLISDAEMLSLFAETPAPAVAAKQAAAENLDDTTDASELEDIPAHEENPADDFGGDFDLSIPDMDESNSFADNLDGMDFGGESFDIPDMDEPLTPDAETSFDDNALDDAGMDLGGETFDLPEIAEPQSANAPIEELDAFDAFDLGGEANPASSFNVPESNFDIDKVAFDDTNKSGAAGDNEFALPGIDDLFQKTADAKSKTENLNAEASAEVEEIQLSQEELSKLEQTLNSYPLNLRIACEELIAEQAVAPEMMSALIKKLVGGANAKDTAAIAGKILGKTIPVPKGFLKKSGEELEAEQSSFTYIFVHNFLPILRTFAIFALLLFCLVFLSHRFIYTPIHAEEIYKRGYELIDNGEYARANEDFIEAVKVQIMKKWFFRYAEAFRDNRQYAFAEQKYDELLRAYQRDKQTALDYAHLETYYLYNYEKANRILRDNILDYSIDDREGLFAQGENFLAWGEIDPAQLENARIAFARLMERYGENDLYLEQMLKYFMRTDNLAQVLPLQNYFFADDKTKISAPTLAELGGYLLDKKFEETQGVPDENIANIEGMRDVLFRAIDEDPSLPESHYHLARYYSRYGSPREEQIVLDTAIKAFDAAPELSAKRLSYRIDTQRRSAWLSTSDQYFVNAQESLIKGIGLYEDALNRRVLSPAPDFGRLYSDLADIEYFKDGDYDAALQNYSTAEESGWHPPEVTYRMGSIYYHTDRMPEAMEKFFEVSNEMPLNRRLLYTLGNTSYLRGDYYAAQGYFNRLLDVLETERVRATTLLPHDRPEHMELAERIMEAQNNLGVTLGTLAERSGNVNYRTRALALYAESARAWDFITRNPTTLVRLFVPGTEIPETNQPLLNTKYTLYPEPGFEPLIYNQIDLDVEDPSTWETLVPSENRARDIPLEIRNE